SRHEMPASTRIRVVDVWTRAQFPRLPLASTETDTLIRSQDTLETCGSGSNFLVSRDLRVHGHYLSPRMFPTAWRNIAPPYEPATPGRKARNDSYTWARSIFCFRTR